MIWIHCYDCGQQTQAPAIGKNQTHQICADCKQERKVKWEAMLAKEGLNA